MKATKRNLIALATIFVLFCGILIPGVQALAKEEEPVTIRVAWWGSDARHAAMLELIDNFMKEYPYITVEPEYQGYDGYYEKMVTSISGGTAPDLFMATANWLPDIQHEESHYLADLAKLPVRLDTLAQSVIDSGSYKDEVLLFSAAVSGYVVYVNVDAAKTYGIDLNKAYTWDEWMELGKSIHEQDPDAYLMTADIDVINKVLVQCYLAQLTGGNPVDAETGEIVFTKEQAEQAFQFVLDLYESNTLEPFGDGSVFTGQMEQNSKWINGKIPVMMDTTTSISKYQASIESDLDVIAIPRNEDSLCSGVSFSGGLGFVINDKGEKEAAALFLDYMMNTAEGALAIKGSYGYNASSVAVEALVKEGFISELSQKAVDIASRDSFAINLISGNEELYKVRADLLQEMIYGDITPESAADDLMFMYQDILDEINE